MKSYFVETISEFRGEFLLPRWAKKNLKIEDDFILSFVGKSVSDEAKNPLMLHFIMELANTPKIEAVLKHRLFLSHLQLILGPMEFIRKDSTLYLMNQPVTESNIVASPFSSVVHIALLVDPEFPPVCNFDAGFFDTSLKEFAISIMHSFKQENAQLDNISREGSVLGLS